MKMMKTMMAAAGVMLTMAVALPSVSVAQTAAAPVAPAAASAPISYTQGTVWNQSFVEIMPGQFQNYMDYLKNEWKPEQEFMKAQGWLVSYHVLVVQSRREDEPNLILVQEWRDHFSTAQREEIGARLRARDGVNQRQGAAANAARMVMRRNVGSMLLQEANLK
jgi:hypothetical protein